MSTRSRNKLLLDSIDKTEQLQIICRTLQRNSDFESRHILAACEIHLLSVEAMLNLTYKKENTKTPPDEGE